MTISTPASSKPIKVEKTSLGDLSELFFETKGENLYIRKHLKTALKEIITKLKDKELAKLQQTSLLPDPPLILLTILRNDASNLFKKIIENVDKTLKIKKTRKSDAQ